MRFDIIDYDNGNEYTMEYCNVCETITPWIHDLESSECGCCGKEVIA